MNISRVISDAMHGRAPRRRELQPGGGSTTLSAEEFLRGEVWPLFREARLAMDARGITAVALQPTRGDPTHSFTLLILDSRRDFEDASFLRFLVQNKQLHFRVKHPFRGDEQPLPLDPPASIVLVRGILEDFLYECLLPDDKKKQPLPHDESCPAGEQSLQGMPELSSAH